MMLRSLPALLLGVASLVYLAPGAARAGEEPIDVSVLTYNVQICFFFCGGHHQDIADVVTASGADIVGLQEDNNDASDVVNLLGAGWGYHDFGNGNGNLNSFDTSILSVYPITDTFSDGVELMLPSGQHAYVWVVHLEPFPYQPYDIRDGDITTPAQAIAEADATRGGMMDSVLAEIAVEAPLGAPVFLVGDFNEPSHLDWTAAAATAGHHFGWAVDWPTSTSVAGDGFTDAFREFSPDEVADLGETWTPAPGANEVHDRIDRVYYAGDDVSLADVAIVGENATMADIVVSPWPSDHRGVVATFAVPEPGQLPMLFAGLAFLCAVGRSRTKT